MGFSDSVLDGPRAAAPVLTTVSDVSNPTLERLPQALIAAGLAEVSVVSREVGDRINRFLVERARWQRTHHLTGPAARADPLPDILDTFALALTLRADLPLVDVGCGGGVPGLLLAALRPHHPIHLVEPAAKRTAFLRTALRALGLEHVKVHRDRWPLSVEVPVQVVSRAVVAPDAWPELALSAGEEVRSVHRMLAARRPAWSAEGFALHAAVDYVVPGAASRRVERWDAVGSDPDILTVPSN